MPSNKKILIIGSSGQIGSAIKQECLKQGLFSLGLDIRPNPWQKEYTNEVADFLSWRKDDTKRFSDIIFLATEASGKKLNEQNELYERDLRLFKKTLEMSRSENSRLIIISSRELFDIEPSNISSYIPKNNYEKQKQLFEESLINGDIKYGIYRSPITFGGFDDDTKRLARIVPRWIECLLAGNTPVIDNPGNKIRLLDVECLASELIKKITSTDNSFIIENKGTEISILDLITLIESLISDKRKADEIHPLEKAIKRTILKLRLITNAVI